MHAEFRLEVLDFDLLARQVFRRDDESEGDGRFVRVQESAPAEAHRRVSCVHERSAFLLAEAESVLYRLGRQLDGLLDSDGDFVRLQIRFQARLPYQRRRRTLREDDEVRCHVVVRRDGNAPHPTALPPQVVDANSSDEHRPGVLGFLRQPRVELRADRGEAGPATLGKLRGIKRDREGRVLGQEGEILPDDEPLDRAVLRPFRKQIDEGPRIDATPEHPLHSGSPAALDEKGREALAGEGQRGRGARGPGPHHDDIKTLHALPVPLRKSGTGKRLSPAHAIGIGCSSNSHRSWPCAIQEISSHRSSFATSRRPIPAIQPARKWQTGFFEGPYALAIGLLCLATLNRPRSGSKWMISVRPHPVSADASIIRFAPSIVSGVETPLVSAPRNFSPESELRSPARYRIPFADPPTVCSSCFWMLTMTSGRRMRHG